MMAKLNELKCEACRSDSPKVTDEEAATYLKEIPEWVILEQDGMRRLERVFKFRNFVKALAFTNSIGALAEQEGHHPAILTEWGKVTVAWWTHAIGGLHKNDFIMAAKTDQAFNAR